MRKCRNWQTSKTKDLVINAIVWVQVPSSAFKKSTDYLFIGFQYFLFCLNMNKVQEGVGGERELPFIPAPGQSNGTKYLDFTIHFAFGPI